MTKHLSKYFVLAILSLGSLVAHAAGRQSFVIVADVEHGLALVPDSAVVPAGVTVYIDNKPLVFAHAPESTFTQARQVIEAAEAPTSQNQPFVVRDRNGAQRHAAGDSVMRIASDNTDITYYVYFYDGSYHAARKIVWDVSPYGTQYGVISSVYTPAGDYRSGSLYTDQTSSEYLGFNQSASSSITSAGGTVSTPFIVYQTSNPFYANVTSTGRIIHRYGPICGRYGEPPCTETFNSTINVTVP